MMATLCSISPLNNSTNRTKETSPAWVAARSACKDATAKEGRQARINLTGQGCKPSSPKRRSIARWKRSTRVGDSRQSRLQATASSRKSSKFASGTILQTLPSGLKSAESDFHGAGMLSVTALIVHRRLCRKVINVGIRLKNRRNDRQEMMKSMTVMRLHHPNECVSKRKMEMVDRMGCHHYWLDMILPRQRTKAMIRPSREMR